MTYLLHALGCVCHVALLFLQQSNSDFLTLTCLLRSGKVSTETGGKVSTEIYNWGCSLKPSVSRANTGSS
jgi:hypothetical protein